MHDSMSKKRNYIPTNVLIGLCMVCEIAKWLRS